MNLKGKKVLLVGLGILGGGLSMAKYLLKKGAILKITDLRNSSDLSKIIKQLPKSIEYTLGRHEEKDFAAADLIIFNPAVSYFSEWPAYCRKNKVPFYNDYTFFLASIKKTNPNAKIIGITGTRGKTTVSNWIHSLIPNSVLAGNIPEKNLFTAIDKKTNFFVLELSSYQLEYLEKNHKAPNVAVLTNIYVDHLNRYKTLKNYKDIKFNIFKNQTPDDALILSAEENIKEEVLKLKPKARIYFVSTKPLPKKASGAFFDSDYIFFQNSAGKTKFAHKSGLAPHEKTNLLFALMAARLSGASTTEILKRLLELKNPKFRQEEVFRNKSFEIYNDSAATSPEATIAAIEKFKDRKTFVLITGGTDKELDSHDLAKKISKNVKPENLFLLEGTATDKLIKHLSKEKYFNKAFAYQNLEDIIDIISQEYDEATVVFSPGAASFEKFKNEFDRGKQFNSLIKKYFD